MRRGLKLGLLVLVGLGLGGCAGLFTPLKAVLTATPTSGTAPLQVQFNLSGSTGPIATWTLTFGDDSDPVTGTGETIGTPVPQTYQDAGTYTATLTVQDARGRTDSASVTITVAAPPTTTVSLGAIPASGNAPLEVNFWANIQAAPMRKIKHIKLSYGDDTSDFEIDVDLPSYSGSIGPVHAYSDPGQYTATLTVKDDAPTPQTFTATASITVTSPPPVITTFSATLGDTTVNFDDADPTLTIAVGNTVDFDFEAEAAGGRTMAKYTLHCPGSNSASAGEWDLSDNPLTRNGLSRIYNTAGTFTATLQVWDDVGNTDTATITIKVETPTP